MLIMNFSMLLACAHAANIPNRNNESTAMERSRACALIADAHDNMRNSLHGKIEVFALAEIQDRNIHDAKCTQLQYMCIVHGS